MKEEKKGKAGSLNKKLTKSSGEENEWFKWKAICYEDNLMLFHQLNKAALLKQIGGAKAVGGDNAHNLHEFAVMK